MIEIKDGMDFHDVLASTRSEAWKKRRAGESPREWLSRVSIPSNKSLELFQWRKNNAYWMESSTKICLSILEYLRGNAFLKEYLESNLGFELDLTSKKDWTISELKKIELITGIKFEI